MNNQHENNDDIECKNIINENDYYEIMGLKKDALEEEIRKSYKKLALKFHPDKNKSIYASDAFKKVSHSFSVLSNKEKKANYDKYGTEDEIVDSSHDHNYYTDDIDPFDLFNMFFGEMTIPRGAGTRTQHVFGNGNVEYKVYSSNIVGSRTYNYQEDSEEEEDNDEDINFGNDLFNQIFNNERRNHYRKSYSTTENNNKKTNQRNEGKRSSSRDRRRNEDEDLDIRNQFSFINAFTSLIQFVIMFFVVFAVVLPNILPKIFRFK